MTNSNGGPERPIQRRDEEPEPETVPVRPSVANFDEWIRKRGIFTMGVVVVTAFLAKALAPIKYSFTLGLLLGIAALVGWYLLEFYASHRAG